VKMKIPSALVATSGACSSTDTEFDPITGIPRMGGFPVTVENSPPRRDTWPTCESETSALRLTDP